MKKLNSLAAGIGRSQFHLTAIDHNEAQATLVNFKRIFTLFTVLILLSGIKCMAQTYYSQGSLNVNVLASWNADAGGAGTTPVTFDGDGIWIIQPGDDMAISGDWVVGTGGTASVVVGGGITISSTYQISITGTLTINGTLTHTGTNTSSSAVTASSGITINGTYYHDQNAGYLPIAAWAAGSNCIIYGWTDAVSLNSSFNQVFYNFTWDCPGQTVNVFFENNVNTVTGTFTLAHAGPGDALSISPVGNPTYGNYSQTNGTYNLTRSSTGGFASTLTIVNDYFINNGNFIQAQLAPGVIVVGGDFIMREWGSHFQAGHFDGSTVTIAGDLNIDDYATYVVSPYDNDGVLDVAGNVTIEDNSFVIMSGWGSGIGTLNVGGDFFQTGGTIQIRATATGSGSIVFDGTGAQTYVSGGALSGTINFSVRSGSFLQMGSGAAPSVISDGTTGTFTLEAGATLGITSPMGISLTGTTGNIQVGGTRTFSPAANYRYNGSVAQNTGDGLPITIRNLTLENTGGVVTFNAARTITDLFSITSGSRANLGSYTHWSGNLSFAGVARPVGSHGHSTSPATYPNDTYFDAATGIINNGFTDGMWLGVTPDWNSAGNWVGGIPGSLSDITIIQSVSYQPVIIDMTAPAVCRNMTINAGASPTINPDQALTINGNLSNSGNLIIQSSGVASSGSLIVNGSSTGSGTVTYNRMMPTGNRWHYVSSPVAVSSIPAGSFYEWDEVAGDWSAGPVSSISSGLGYTLQTTGNSVAFSGSLLTADLNITATSPYVSPFNGLVYTGRELVTGRGYGGGGWNLLGNPYASAINVSAFISANFNTDPSLSSFDPNYVALYLYNGSTYQYVTSDETGWELDWPNGVYLDADYIQTGQGFFVLAMNDGVTFNFAHDMQAHNTGTALLKSGSATANRWPGLALKVESGNTTEHTSVIFHDGMTAGLDPVYDIGYMASGSAIQLYTALVESNGVNFARQALPENGALKNIVQVGIDFVKGGSVVFSAETEPLRSYKYWLEDRVTGIFTDLSRNSYAVNLPPNTLGTGRFFVHVSAGRTVRPRVTGEYSLDIRIWASPENQINIQGPVSENAVCQIFDTEGRKLYEGRLPDSDLNVITLSTVKTGVYFVIVKDGSKVISQKIVII